MVSRDDWSLIYYQHEWKATNPGWPRIDGIVGGQAVDVGAGGAGHRKADRRIVVTKILVPPVTAIADRRIVVTKIPPVTAIGRIERGAIAIKTISILERLLIHLWMPRPR